VQPFYLAPGVLVIKLCPRSIGLQVAVLVGVEQAIEVEASGPLVLGLQDRLGVVQADPPDVLGERAIGARQFLRGDAQSPVRLVDLDQRVVGYCRLLLYSSMLACITILQGDKLYVLPRFLGSLLLTEKPDR
jgi:hypothetical protein